MSRIQIKRPQQVPKDRAPLETAVRRNTAWAAGSEEFQHRDPLYHVTESFQQNFDAMGRKHAITRTGGEPEEKAEGPDSSKENANPQAAENEGLFKKQDILQKQERGMGGDLADMSSAKSFYEMKSPEDQAMLQRFSETAFQRGTMSGAVLRGSGRVMLFSCLKNTVGQVQNIQQERKLFDHASQQRNVPGHGPDQVVFNRGVVDSAVGIVVDTLRDARRTVESMQDLVNGRLNDTEGGAYGADTLRTMYPFLDDSRERGLLEDYYSKLRGSDLSPDERGIIQNAIGRTRALIDRKDRMRTEFMNKLRFISDRATEALTEFEGPGFTAALTEALEEQTRPGIGGVAAAVLGELFLGGGGGAPGDIPPDGSNPDGSTPDGSSPEGGNPDGSAPSGSPDGQPGGPDSGANNTGSQGDSAPTNTSSGQTPDSGEAAPSAGTATAAQAPEAAPSE